MDNSRLSGGLSLILCGIALIIYKLFLQFYLQFS